MTDQTLTPPCCKETRLSPFLAFHFDFQPSHLTCGQWEKTSYSASHSFTLIHSHTTLTVMAFCQYTNSLVTHLKSICKTMYDRVILFGVNYAPHLS